MEQPKIDVGIIGYGKVGKVRRGVIEKNPCYRLRALCDSTFSSNGGPGEAGYRTFSDYRALLQEDLDAIFVCTPNDVTSGVVVEALSSGKHVFCEKPPGRNLPEIRSILREEAKNPKLRLKFGFNHRYHAAIRQAYATLSSGRLGPILWMRGIYGKSGGDGFETIWRSQRERAGGGILLDQGIHLIDLFRLFCGDFSEVKSFVCNSHWNIDVEDNAFALLKNSMGQVAMLHSSSTQWKHMFSLEIYARDGYVAINGILSGTRSYGRETLIVARKPLQGEPVPLGQPREEVTYFDEDESWQAEVDEFADCIVNDKKISIGDSYDALKAMELVQQIYQNDPAWAARQPAEKAL